MPESIQWLAKEVLSLNAEFSFKIYEFIERDFNLCLEYISLDKEQLKVYSYRLGDLIQRIGPEILRVFELILFNSRMATRFSRIPELKRKILNIQRKQKARKDSFIDYLKAFSCLNQGKIYQVEVQELGNSILPFETKKKGKKEFVFWWEHGYNALRHRRTKEFSKSATLGFALFSLAGLWILQHRLDSFIVRKEMMFSRKSSVFGYLNFLSERPDGKKLSYNVQEDEWVVESL